MNVRSSHISTGYSKYGAQIPKGFSVRIFKSPALSNFSYGVEPKFDIGYRPKTPTNTWQEPTWSTTHSNNEQHSRDARSRAPRVFANTLSSDLHVYGDGHIPDYSIYPSTANDTYIYERSLDAYTETDATSEVTLSPSCFSTLSNESTTTLLSTLITDSPIEDPNIKRGSFLTQHSFRVNLPSLSRTLSSGIGTRGTNTRPSSFSRSPTPAPIIRPSSSFSPDRDVTYVQPQSPLDLSPSTQLNGSDNLGTSYPQSSSRSSPDREQPKQNSQATRKSTNRTSFFLGKATRSSAEQNTSGYSTRSEEARLGSRVSSLLASAGPSDGLSSTKSADVHSAAATRNSSPPRQTPQKTAARASLRIITNRDEFPQSTQLQQDVMTANGVPPGPINNDHEDRHDYIYAYRPGRDSGYARPVYRDEPQTILSTQLEISSASVPAEQPMPSSRTLDDRRRRAAPQPNLGSSEGVARERATRPLSQSVDSANQIDFPSTSFESNSRNFRNSFIEVGQLRQDETQYAVNSNIYDRHDRPVSRVQSPAQISPSHRTSPPRGDTTLANNKDTYPPSTSNVVSSRIPARRELNSQVASCFPRGLPDGSRVNSPQRQHSNSDERQSSNVFAESHLPSSVTGGYPQDGLITYPRSAPRELSRAHESLSASQARNDAGYHAELHPGQRRDSDEQRRRPGPTSYEGQLQTDIDLGRRTSLRPNQPENQRARIETRRPSDELDDPALRSATPGGTRCVRWNPNLIAPSPIFASQRWKGWFNRRGDQLWTNDGAYKPPHPDQEYPLDLADYPDYGEGWMNEVNVRIDMQHRLIPKPPLRSALKKS